MPQLAKMADELTIVRSMHEDLKQRSLLRDLMAIGGGEFGRTPVAQVLGNTWGA